MPDKTFETKPEKLFKAGKDLITNKQSRSIIFLIITCVFILGINALLPVMQNEAHYTSNSIEVTYQEYLQMKDKNVNYNLRYSSKAKILLYQATYAKNHPDLTDDQLYNIEIPADFKVEVYTKFFFESSLWYISTGMQIMSVIMIYYSLFNYLITKAKYTDPNYLSLSKELNDMNDTSLDPVTFEPWMIDDFNKPRKIAQHISNVKVQISRLTNKQTYLVRYWANKKEALDNGTITGPLEIPRRYKRRVEKYLNKKHNLEMRLEENYIEQYVVYGKVKHFKFIHPSFVTCGVNKVGYTTDSYSLIDSDSSRISKDAVRKVGSSAFITIAFALLMTVTVVVFNDQSVTWIIINAFSKITPLIFQVPSAQSYKETFLKNQLITNLNQRRSIALLYLANMERKKQKEMTING